MSSVQLKAIRNDEKATAKWHTFEEVVQLIEWPNGDAPSPKRSHTFEEAVELIKIGRTHHAILFVTFTAVMAVIIEGLNMGFVLPLAKCDLAITATQQGIINAIGFISFVLASYFWGLMADTIGRIKILRTSLAMSFLFCTLSSFSWNSDSLLWTRFLAGIFLAGIQSTAMAYLSEFHCTVNRARYTKRAALGMTASLLFQAAIGLAILPMDWSLTVLGGAATYKPWRLYLLVTSLLMAIAFGVTMFLPESPKFLLANGKPAECLQVLKRLYDQNRNDEEYPIVKIIPTEQATAAGGNVNVLRTMWTQTYPIFLPPLLSKTVLLSFVLTILYFITHGLFLWFPQIMAFYQTNVELPVTLCAAIQMSSNASSSSVIIRTLEPGQQQCHTAEPNYLTYNVSLIYGAALIIIYLAAAQIMENIGKTVPIAIWATLTGLATMALIWTNNFHLNMIMFLIMFTAASCGSIICSIATEFYPTKYRSMAMALIIMFSRIGSFAGSNITGMMLFGYCHEMLGSYGAALIVAALAYVLMMMRFIKRDLQ